MKNRLNIVAAAAISLALGLGANTAASAHGHAPAKRLDHQQDRIAKGVLSGELTAQETARLAREQARTERHLKAARSDGRVTAKERARLHADLNQNSRHIYRQKHD